MMLWVATEDVDTCEVTDFEPADEEEVLWLMEGYRVDASSPDPIRVRDVEEGQNVVYIGAIYKGGFGVSLWVARRYREL